jgi:hypothetical protein
VADPILDKIRKLMALALHNPNVEEARSAAMKAVQLIAEHQFAVGRPAPAAPMPDLSGLDEMLRTMRKQQDEEFARARARTEREVERMRQQVEWNRRRESDAYRNAAHPRADGFDPNIDWMKG